MWNELKKILQNNQDKGIIIEDGEPRYVILSIAEYNRLTSSAREVKVEEYKEDTPQERGVTAEDLPF